MNLVLSFVHPKKPSRTVGPFHCIRLDGDSVRNDQGGDLVAQHRDHVWEVQGERYYRLDATTRVCIHFERLSDVRSRNFGPYERFSAIDGIAYADNRVFAFVDPKFRDWYCYDDGSHWPVMVVTDDTVRNDSRLIGMLAGLAPLVSGVIGLWHGARLLYLGTAVCLRSRFASLLEGGLVMDGKEISAVTWEAHADPAVREAELLAEYAKGSPTLRKTYGALHGNHVRTARLVARAADVVESARVLRDTARSIRAMRAAW